MGAYAGTPTLLIAFEQASKNGQSICVVKRLTLTLSTQGGLTNTIGAAALGFRAGGLISAECILFVDGGSAKRWIGLFTDGTNIYTADPTVAVDANRGAAADVSGTLTCDVRGLV